jgi:hypothetical protein
LVLVFQLEVVMRPHFLALVSQQFLQRAVVKVVLVAGTVRCVLLQLAVLVAVVDRQT